MTIDPNAAPCPWHGDNTELSLEDNGVGCFWIICTKTDCGCEGPYSHSATDAWAAWNRRAPAAQRDDCATEGCYRAATERFESGGVGSRYCSDCAANVRQVVAAPTAMQPEDGLVRKLLSAARKVRALKEWVTLAGATKTTLHRLAEASEEAAAIITSLRAENARLRAGLKPFARMAEADDYAGTPEGASVIMNVDRLRAARQIIDQEAGK